MATIKGYSVAKTQKGYGSAVAASTVYSLGSSVPSALATGSGDSYNFSSMNGGKTNTLLKQNQTLVNHDVTDLANPATNATGTFGNSALVTATTTTVTTGKEGAGLIIRFATTSSGTLPAFGDGNVVASLGAVTGDNFNIVNPGEGYDSSTVVEIDGFPGSRVTVTAA